MYDFFICHASEDKESFVRPLADRLVNEGFRIWYDEYSLTIGDRLRKKIEKGLINSKYGIVILSTNFFKKDWPQSELDGLFSLEINDEKKIIPIWHQIEHDEILKYSPILAGRLAAKSKDGLDKISDELKKLFPLNNLNKVSENNKLNIDLPNIPRKIDKAELKSVLNICYEKTKQYFGTACILLEQKYDYISTECHEIEYWKFICAINYKASKKNIIKCKIWIRELNNEADLLVFKDVEVDLHDDLKCNEYLHPEYDGFNFKIKTSGLNMKNDYYKPDDVPEYLWKIFISKIEYKEDNVS